MADRAGEPLPGRTDEEIGPLLGRMSTKAQKHLSYEQYAPGISISRHRLLLLLWRLLLLLLPL